MPAGSAVAGGRKRPRAAPAGGSAKRAKLTTVAKQQKAPATKQQKTPLAKQQKTPPAKQQKTPPAKQQKTPPAKQQKAPAKQQKTPAKQQKTPAKQQKTPAKQQKTPAKQQKTPAKQQKTPAKQQHQTSATSPAKQRKSPANRKSSSKSKASSNHRPPMDGSCLLLSHLPHGLYERELRAFLSQFGSVLRIRVPRSTKTNNAKGVAFVEMGDPEVAQIAAKTLNNYLMFTRLLKCKVVSQPRRSTFSIGGAKKTAGQVDQVGQVDSAKSSAARSRRLRAKILKVQKFAPEFAFHADS